MRVQNKTIPYRSTKHENDVAKTSLLSTVCLQSFPCLVVVPVQVSSCAPAVPQDASRAMLRASRGCKMARGWQQQLAAQLLMNRQQ